MGLIYVRPVKTVWIADGGSEALIYDPKSGENVSSNVSLFETITYFFYSETFFS